MSRRQITFECEGSVCAASIDEAPGTTGLLIVTGGNEVRAGAWNGQALMAARIAAAGFPVFRFDRRGVGDSAGGNGGFLTSGPDIAAALAAFRVGVPHLERVIGFGNCDGASALMLTEGAGFEGLILSNPWTIENDSEEAAAPPPAALRSHYLRRLRDPGAILRLIAGKVSLRALATSLLGALRPTPPPSTLAIRLAEGLTRFSGPVSILLASRDRTAQAFEAAWPKGDARVQSCENATHSYVEPQSEAWLEARLIDMLRG